MPGPRGGALPALWTGVLRSGGSRLLVLPVAAVLGMVATRVLVDHGGSAAYARYGLLVGIGALLPFTDLGMSAAVVDAVATAADPGRDERVRRTLLTAVRVLLGSSAVLLALTAAVTAAGLWPALLGPALGDGGGPATAAACLVLIALGVPVGIGQRVLVGLHRNHVVVLVLGLQSPLVLAALLLLVHAGAPAVGGFAVVPYAVTLVLSAACTLLAARAVRPALGDAVRQVARLRTRPGARVLGVAWPMLVQMVAVPVAMQSDRLVLSHAAGVTGLAGYNLAAQMFTPVWAVVSAAGSALWPVFARSRAEGRQTSPFPVAGVFAAAGGLAALAIALLSPVLARLATGGRIHLPALLVVAFVLLEVVQAAKVPLGMYLTDAAGLRFQAAMITGMLAVNLGLSVVLTGPVGAAGPVLGSVVAVSLFELGANAWCVAHRRRRAAPAADPAPGPRLALLSRGR